MNLHELLLTRNVYISVYTGFGINQTPCLCALHVVFQFYLQGPLSQRGL